MNKVIEINNLSILWTFPIMNNGYSDFYYEKLWEDCSAEKKETEEKTNIVTNSPLENWLNSHKKKKSVGAMKNFKTNRAYKN
jgi:hypothetical protein